MNVLIEGDFLANKITGLERAGYELLSAIDKLLVSTDAGLNARIELAVPGNALAEYSDLIQSLKMIQPSISHSANKLLENHYVWMLKHAFSRNQIIVDLVKPMTLKRGSIVKIADVRYMEKNRDGYYWDDKKFRLKSSLATNIGIHNAKYIVTVSDFSKSRIMYHFGVPDEKIKVIGEAWQHFERIQEDDSIFEKYPRLKHKDYYFTVGTLASHKNHKWIKDAAQDNKESIFVICGGIAPGLWKEGGGDSGDNLIFTGRLNDGAMKALMRHAKAFLFPSFYEGFGMPPLEAMSVGTDCIISDIPVHREIYGDSVYYIDPYDANVNLDRIMSEKLKVSKNEILSKYSWEKSAKEWLKLMIDLQ